MRKKIDIRGARLRIVVTVLVVLSAVGAGCPSSNDADGFPYHDFHMELKASMWEIGYHDGEWDEDFGDAAYYGLAYYVRTGMAGNETDLARAREVMRRNLTEIRTANEDYIYFIEFLDEIMMAALGMIEYMAATGDTEPLADVDLLIESRINHVFDAFGPYIEGDMDFYALRTYGPTTIAGVCVLVNLRYAELLDTDKNQERIDYGLQVIGVIDEKVWDGARYLYRPDTQKMYLYPNATMIIANGLAYKLTGEQIYLTHALAVHEAISSLWDAEKKCYRSPYSAEFMGAQTEEYITLSSQNYTIMALAILYEITADDSLLEEINGIVKFVKDYLYVDGKIYHHWMDGRLAISTDPEYFCTGCNLQFLYVIWYVETYLYGATGAR